MLLQVDLYSRFHSCGTRGSLGRVKGEGHEGGSWGSIGVACNVHSAFSALAADVAVLAAAAVGAARAPMTAARPPRRGTSPVQASPSSARCVASPAAA